MDGEEVKAYFESGSAVEHYADAAARIGLWKSEEKIFTRLFGLEDSLLELGAGAGRIAFGLHELGYRNILATDYAKPMVQRARSLGKLLEYSVPFHVADARKLKFEDGIFDGAIFGFNGLMQIPSSAARELALREIYRVLKPESWFVFTTHDRERSMHQDFWIAEKRRWDKGKQSPELEIFGDRAEGTSEGMHFMHVPAVEEMEAVLSKVGFRVEATVMRSEIGPEPPDVEAFSDDCRFWVVEKTS